MSASTVNLLPRGTLLEDPAAPAPETATAAPVSTEPKPQKLPLAKSSARDHRLDFWRGLCLIDMLLVHLVHQGMHLGEQANLWIGEYTRFAAGGFVFIAGLSISRIFLPRARDPERRWATYKALWKRSLVILLVHFIAEIGFLCMWPMFAGVSFRRVLQPIWAIITLRGGYDLLPFYVVMVALAPAMLELMRRRLWWVLLAGSIGLFVWAHVSGAWYTNSLPFQHDFYPVLWQVIFVAGVLSGDVLTKYDTLRARTKLALLALFAVAHAVLFLAYYGPNFGVHIYQYVPVQFKKVPLTDGEVLRYLTLIGTIMIATDLLWRRVDGGRVAGFSERLGRNSLAVYVFHVWVVQILVRASEFVPIGAWRWVMAAIGLGMLWAFARLLEIGGPKSAKKAKAAQAKKEEPRTPPTHVRRSWTAGWEWLLTRRVGGMAGLAVCTLVALVVVNYEQSHYSRRLMMGRRNTPSPVSDLLYPRDDQPLPDFIPDPYDPPDDEEEEPVVPKEPIYDDPSNETTPPAAGSSGDLRLSPFGSAPQSALPTPFSPVSSSPQTRPILPPALEGQ